MSYVIHYMSDCPPAITDDGELVFLTKDKNVYHCLTNYGKLRLFYIKNFDAIKLPSPIL